jgi:hypothetical protein
MTDPIREALKPCPFCSGEAEYRPNPTLGDNSMAVCQQCGASAFWRKWNRRVLTTKTSDDVVERVARTICKSGKFECGEGACSFICLDQLGVAREPRCSHVVQVHGDLARAAIAAISSIPKGDEGERARELEALTPSAATKAAYMGEFSFPIIQAGEDGEEVSCKTFVPWTTIKEIMAAIRTRALQSSASASLGGEE